jgi:hypothetical protein
VDIDGLDHLAVEPLDDLAERSHVARACGLEHRLDHHVAVGLAWVIRVRIVDLGAE